MIDQERRLFAYLLSYACLLIIGGVFAHESQSMAAIVWSVISGMAVLAGSWMVWRGRSYALTFNLFLVLGLTLFFIYRTFLIHKFYPPGFLTLVSLFLAFQIGLAKFKRKKSHHA